MKCGGCGKRGKPGKGWRVRGKWWARCPACVKQYAKTLSDHEELDREAEERGGGA